VGKTSCHTCVCEYFREIGREVVATREPGGTPEAEKIRQVLLDTSNDLDSLTEVLLMFASRSEHLRGVIRPALAEGKVVVSDRFVDASYAYQGGARGLGNDVIARLDELVVADTQPDLTLLLDLDVEAGMKRMVARGKRDRIELEQQAFFEQARQTYLDRAKQSPGRFRVIDASPELVVVRQAIRDQLDQFMQRHGERDKKSR